MTPADRSLATIRDLYRQLQQVPGRAETNRQASAAYTTLVAQIQVAVAERRRIVGDEWVLVADMAVVGHRGRVKPSWAEAA